MSNVSELPSSPIKLESANWEPIPFPFPTLPDRPFSRIDEERSKSREELEVPLPGLGPRPRKGLEESRDEARTRQVSIKEE